MKNLGNYIILFSILINQFVWPIEALAQSVDTPTPEAAATTEPTLTPTLIPTDTPTLIVTPAETPTLEPTPTIVEIPTPIPTETELPTPTASASAILSVEPVSTQTPMATVIVVVNNQTNTDTGNNQIGATALPTISIGSTEKTAATIISGQAIAMANVVNVANATTDGSTIKVYLLNNLNGEVGQIDLNTAWNLLNNNTGNINVLTVDTTNVGAIQNTVSVSADTGSNSINGGEVNLITSGNAYALANVFNLLNINLRNSQMFLGVINVDGSTLGDLILPNPSYFMSDNQSDEPVSGQVTNSAAICSQAIVSADSGSNHITGGDLNSIQTGNAQSVATISTIANITSDNNQHLLIGLNTLGDWSGSIYNLNGPGTVTAGNNFNLFDIGNNSGYSGVDGNASVDNTANITNSVTVESKTGNNSINSTGGTAKIQTGSAWGVVNIANLANLNLTNSRWFMGFINIIGNWRGNVIFAYPDLTMSLSLANNQLKNEDETDITVNYTNVGNDTSHNSKIKIELPNNILCVNNCGSNLTWNVGTLKAKEAGHFVIRVKIVKGQTAWWKVKPVYAAEAIAKSEVIINGQIITSDTEVSTNNNSATAVANVVVEGSTVQAEASLWPKLVISEKNNVNNWVYKNDIVTFEVEGKNEGEATAYNSFIVQTLYDKQGNVLAVNKIKVGKVGVSRNGKITFGVPIVFNLPQDSLVKSRTEWFGYTERNEEVRSNTTESTFVVKTGVTINKSNIGEVQAINTNSEVLGTVNVADKRINYLPYLLLFMLSTFWILIQTNKWLKK